MFNRLKKFFVSNKQNIQGDNNTQVGRDYINIISDDIPASNRSLQGFTR